MSEKLVSIKIGDRGVGLAGKRARPGKVYKATEKDAKFLIATGKAVPVGEKAPNVDNREKDIDVTERADKKK